MKILLVNDNGCLNGGAEVIVFGLRDELRKRGHDVMVFTSAARDGDAPLLADRTCFGTTKRTRTLLQCMNLAAAHGLRKIISEFQPDVVHVNLYLTQLSPFILRCLRDVPSVYYAQWYRAVCPLGTRHLPDARPCMERAGRACLKNGCLPFRAWLPLQGQRLLDSHWHRAFNRVSAISQTVADKLATFGGADFGEIEVIHAGTPDALCRREFSEKPVFLFAGRLVPEKGCRALLRAFAVVLKQIPEARLVLIGDGPERQHLRELAGSLGVATNVDLKGSSGNAETKLAMRSAWAVCVPSIWEEPFGLVAAEAQMNGVPVIASRSGGLAEIVTPESGGLLVPPGDPDSLAEAMLSFAADRSQMSARGASAHQHAMKSFRISSCAERFEKLYLSMVGL